MKETLKQVKQTFIKNPIVAFIIITLCAVWYLYNDLSMFIQEQQKILTQQVIQQQKTTDLLGQISQRISQIELKLYDKNYRPQEYPINKEGN